MYIWGPTNVWNWLFDIKSLCADHIHEERLHIEMVINVLIDMKPDIEKNLETGQS